MPRNEKSGFTLIEIIAAMMIFAFSATAIMGLFLQNLRLMAAARREMIISMIIEEIVARNQAAVHLSSLDASGNRTYTNFKDGFGDPTSNAWPGAVAASNDAWGIRNIATYNASSPADCRWEDNDLVADEFVFAVEDVSREDETTNTAVYLPSAGGALIASHEDRVRTWIEDQQTDFDGSGDTDGDNFVAGIGTSSTTFVAPKPGDDDVGPGGRAAWAAAQGVTANVETAVPNLHNSAGPTPTPVAVYGRIQNMWYYKRLRLTIGWDFDVKPAGGVASRSQLLREGRTQTFYFTLIANDLNKMDYPLIDPAGGQHYRRDVLEGRDKSAVYYRKEGFGEDPAGTGGISQEF